MEAKWKRHGLAIIDTALAGAAASTQLAPTGLVATGISSATSSLLEATVAVDLLVATAAVATPVEARAPVTGGRGRRSCTLDSCFLESRSRDR